MSVMSLEDTKKPHWSCPALGWTLICAHGPGFPFQLSPRPSVPALVVQQCQFPALSLDVSRLQPSFQLCLCSHLLLLLTALPGWTLNLTHHFARTGAIVESVTSTQLCSFPLRCGKILLSQ